MRKMCALLLAFLPLAAMAQRVPEEQKRIEVQRTLSEFIIAFDNLDWEKFRSAFADNATVFYPREFPRRAAGRAEFEETFKRVFEQIRAGRSTPPFMDIQPHEMEIRIFGDIAIAAFHLDDKPHFVNRRTIVLRNTSTGWKIIHLHASEVQTGVKP